VFDPWLLTIVSSARFRVVRVFRGSIPSVRHSNNDDQGKKIWGK
jgi:hypothetical protein